MFEAVLFDLDETLFDRSASLRAFVRFQLAGSMLPALGDAALLVDRFLALDSRGRAPKQWVYRTILDEIGVHDERLSMALFADYEMNAWRFARPFDGMEELLSWLKRSGIPVGIVSNGQTHIQLRSVEALKLDKMVDVCLISEQEACRKPESEIFRRAAGRLGAPVECCVFVGDSPEADIFGARNVGMRTIWFPNGEVWPEDYAWRADASVASLSEAQTVLQRWLGR